MAKYFKGSELKFSVNITAPGFSMDDDDFEIEITSPGTSVKGYKNPPAGSDTDVIIYKETPADNSDSSDSSSSSSASEQDTWYVIVDTKKLNKGDMKVITTAHIPDAHANDGIRDDIAVWTLGTLVNP